MIKIIENIKLLKKGIILVSDATNINLIRLNHNSITNFHTTVMIPVLPSLIQSTNPQGRVADWIVFVNYYRGIVGYEALQWPWFYYNLRSNKNKPNLFII